MHNIGSRPNRAARPVVVAVVAVGAILVSAVGVGAGIAQARPAPGCSNASLRGGYGGFTEALILPARTPRSILHRFVFDGAGHFTIALTFNDNGTVTHATDAGPYTVNADCTGKIVTNGGTGTIETVLVDGGNEFYSLRTDPPSILFQYDVNKKQLPGENADVAQVPPGR